MSNVIALTFPRRLNEPAAQVAALADCFATSRRHVDDVYWLKENAELLNILECSGFAQGDAVLSAYAPTYQTIAERLAFFPQYYRFLLSICLDLEDLGMPGQEGEVLSQKIAQAGFAEAELSDLQRAEARRLLNRRGQHLADDAGLSDRLRAFSTQSAAFAVPNKKIAYELTHIVFYLSDYGRNDPQMPQQAKRSLHHVGTLAYLECNTDLLAEVCLALRFSGWTPPAVWEEDLARQTVQFDVRVQDGPGMDDYHTYLMAHWHRFVTGGTGFAGALAEGGMSFLDLAKNIRNPLREMSELLLAMGVDRSPAWGAMRGQLRAGMTPAAWSRLERAVEADDGFADFFATFARAGQNAPRHAVVG